MKNFFDDNEDIKWYLEKGIDWDPIVRLTEYDMQAPDAPATVEEAVGNYRDILDAVGAFVAETVAPRWAELDAGHPHLRGEEVEEAEVVRELTEGLGQMGLFGLCVPRELGGTNMPLILFQLTQELIARADTSLCAHVGFHGGIAMAGLLYSVLEGTTTFTENPPRILKTRFQEMVEEIVAGKAWGSMDITEPGAGSDMAALTTRGVQRPDGSWVVSGQKIFITSGHGRWHFVIARTEDAKGEDAFGGLKGLSLFLVPAWDWGPNGEKIWKARFAGVEQKLGHAASATVTISFEESPAMLVGERGKGFSQMLVLMNNARIGVAFESLGVAEAAWRAAKDYAAQRPSMGKTIDRHEMIAEILEGMQTDIQAIRAMGIEAAWNEEMAQKIELALRFLPMDTARREGLLRQQARCRKRSRELTPVLKWFASERCVDIARKSIQVHGGSGYIRETGVEKLLRDAMVFPIYEGTSQIQALMAMKDNLLAVLKAPGPFFAQLLSTRTGSLAGGPDGRVLGLRHNVLSAIYFLIRKLAGSKFSELPLSRPGAWKGLLQNWDPKRDFALAMLHAERLISLLADAQIAEILQEQSKKDPKRAELLERWLEKAEPRSNATLQEIYRIGPRLLARLESKNG